MIEMLRRVVLAIGLFSGLWFLSAIPTAVFRVEPIDWNAEKLSKQDRATDATRIMSHEVGADQMKGVDLAPETRGTLEAFIQSTTKDRLLKVSNEAWGGFFNAIAATSLGNPPSKEWAGRRGRSYYNDSLYFRPSEGPLPEIAKSFDADHTFSYVAISGESRTEYLAVTRVSGNDLLTQAPFELVYPTRNLGWLSLLATLLVYALLPWPKVPQESIRYSRVRGSVLADVIGAVVGGMFFVLPFFITNANGYGEGVFGSGGWVYLTGVCWFLAVLILSVWPIAAWFASLSLQILPDGLLFTSLRERLRLDPADIEQVTIGRMDSPKLSRALIIISALVSWRALGMALIASKPEYAFRLKLKNGRNLGFAGTGLIGMPQMVGWLRHRGVQIDPEVFELINRSPKDSIYEQPFPPLGTGKGMLVALVCFAAPLAIAWVKTLPSDALAIPHGPLSTQPYIKPQSNEWVPSSDLMQKEDALLKELTKLHAKMGSIDAKLKTATGSEKAGLLKEYDSCFERVTKIQEEFDQARKAAGAPD